MDMNESWFMDWYYSHASADEKRLHDRMSEFDDYFLDMRFEKGTKAYDLIKCQSKPTGSDEWIDVEAMRPDVLEYFSTTFIKTKVEELEGCCGYYNHQEQVLCVSPKYVDDDATVLHEMIHLFESIINELPLYVHFIEENTAYAFSAHE